MSYIKITTPDGKERGLKFNQMAILIMQEKTDPSQPIATGAYALIYAGLKADCYVKQIECDFTFEQVCDWVDVLPDTEMNKIQAAFQETDTYKKGLAYKKQLEDQAKSKSKKKSPLKNTKASASK